MTANLTIVKQEKHCNKCGQTKPATDFYPHKANGLSASCKLCHRAYLKGKKYKLDKNLESERQKRWREKVKNDPARYAKLLENKNKWNTSPKYYDMYYKKRFGISYADVLSMLANQNGLCANSGCQKELSLEKGSGSTKAVVDHCHLTGKVRALLCIRCNTTLGHIEKDEEVVLGLMDYLSKHNKKAG